MGENTNISFFTLSLGHSTLIFLLVSPERREHAPITSEYKHKRGSYSFSNWLNILKKRIPNEKQRVCFSIDLMIIAEWKVDLLQTKTESEQATLNDGGRGMQVF